MSTCQTSENLAVSAQGILLLFPSWVTGGCCCVVSGMLGGVPCVGERLSGSSLILGNYCFWGYFMAVFLSDMAWDG